MYYTVFYCIDCIIHNTHNTGWSDDLEQSAVTKYSATADRTSLLTAVWGGGGVVVGPKAGGAGPSLIVEATVMEE